MADPRKPFQVPQATTDHTAPIPHPAFRRLRGYAFDPSISIKLETMSINEIVYQIPWEDGLRAQMPEWIICKKPSG
jgi:hypothetical protein